MKKTLGILGIDHPDTSKLLAISEYCKIDLITGIDKERLIQTATEFDVPFVVTEQENDFKVIDDQLWENDTKTYAGGDAIAQCCENENLSHVWINYGNLIGLKAALFALKTNKIVGIHSLDLIFQCGALLKDIAQENASFLSSTDSEFNFYYKNVLNYDLKKIIHVSISFSENDELNNFKKAIGFMKVLSSLNNTQISFFQNKSNTSVIEIHLDDGEVITHQKQCIPFSILNYWFDIPAGKSNFISAFQTSENTPLNWSINKQWYTNDAFALAFMAQEKNWVDFQLDNDGSSFPKIATLQEVKEMLINSNRTDLDS